MIPEAKKAAVKQALQLTFGVSELEDIRALNAGLSSALIFRIVVLGKPYLLRIITRDDAMSDPTHWYNCMEAAAETGLAPRVWYAGIPDRICITDFIDARPLSVAQAAAMLPDVLRGLQALSPFPFRVNYLDAVDGFIQRFKAAKILPESMTDELFGQYERIRAIYPYNVADLVASHNDLKPENILFDGERVWLVDWEAAFLNDRYADLAVVANFVVTNDSEEKAYLEKYLNEEADDYRLACFFLMRQVFHMSYFTFFMLLVSGAGIPIDPNSTRPDFRAFHNDMWTGTIDLANVDARQQYAWVHLAQLQHNFQSPRFEEALRVVGEGVL